MKHNKSTRYIFGKCTVSSTWFDHKKEKPVLTIDLVYIKVNRKWNESLVQMCKSKSEFKSET